MTTSLLAPTRIEEVEGEVDERLARADLRRQIARLEIRGHRAPGGRGPRLLGLDELEATRNEMLHGPAAPVGPVEARSSAHARLEAMLADPAAHRHERIALRELGRPGCGSYMVKPRLGLVGMLAGWWEVKLSSGCP
jgi:hypothetical protein